MHSSLIWMMGLVFVGYSLAAANNISLRISPSGLVVSRVEDSLNLTCQVVSSINDPVKFKLEWIPPTVPLSEYSRVNLTSRNNSLNFQLSQVQESDSGIYVCNGSSAEEESQMITTNVTVVVIPKKGSCGQNFFLCNTKQCIPRRFLCDGVRDCPDGSDESVIQCGQDPCQGKLFCDDGRCLDLKYCCDQSSHDPTCSGYRSSCCSKRPDDGFGNPQLPSVMDQHRHYESDMSFLQSTIYTIIGCAIAFIIIVTIMVVAVCRVHMKQAAMSLNPRRLVSRTPLYWTRRATLSPRPPPPNDLDSYLSESAFGGAVHPFSCTRPSANLLVTYNINNGVQLMGNMVDPPSYSEAVEPPPPYSSSDNLYQDFRSTR